jgi:histidinol-phosphatase
MSDASLLQAVGDLVRVGGREALRRFGGRVAVELKADGSPVTEADRATERVMREWITARFPGDGILGEEGGEERAQARRRWIVDPIDGTQAYWRGVPIWGTIAAVAEGDTVLAGGIFCPAIGAGELVCAARGEGCWHDGVRAQVSDIADIKNATVLSSDTTFRKTPELAAGWQSLARAAKITRGWGDCYGYLLVATGRAEVMVDPVMAAWDSAPLQPIIEEAGGVFTDWSGRTTAFGGSTVATNAALASETRALLGGRA